MKKTAYLLAGAGLIMTACDPTMSEKDFDPVLVSADELNGLITFAQYSKTDSVTPAEDGNWITYATNPATIVSIYNLDSDGNENLISYGNTEGAFLLSPRRGASTEQTIYVRVANSDGTTTVAEKSLHVYVPTELTKEIKLLASDAGTKIWKWDTEFREDGAVWGNLGYSNGPGENWSNGCWWGAKPEYLENPDADGNTQLGHSDTGVATGEGDANAYMTFDEDGKVICYDKDGNQIRKGNYTVIGYTGERSFASADGVQENWSLGTLKTDAGSILWPFWINANSYGRDCKPTEFEIMQLDASHLQLIYPITAETNAAGSWSEATWWAFKSNSDKDMSLTGESGSKDWTWDTEFREDGAVWGNLGYSCDSGENWSNGCWWGCKPEYLENPDADGNTQLSQSDTGEAIGEGDPGAYMTFSSDGKIACYDKDGKQIRSGSYEISKWNMGLRSNASADGAQASWSLGTLTTSQGAILWPFWINANSHGRDPMPTEFEIMQLDASHLQLIYPIAAETNAAGNWSEATWWAFKAK